MKKDRKITPKGGRSVVIDTTLDKFSDKVLFKKKVERAKRVLKQTSLPKELSA